MRRRTRLCAFLASGLLAAAVSTGLWAAGRAAPVSAGRGTRHAVKSAAAASSIGFDGERAFADLKHLVDFGPRPPGSKALAESRQWISHELKAAGCTVDEDSFVASTPVGEIPMTNLIARIPGARPEIVMVTGHYDTMRLEGGRFVGANDGGSSAAFLIELGRQLCRRKNPVTYWLVWFDGEEALVNWSSTDSVYGSRHLAQKLTASGELSRIQAMILVDMIADAKLDIYRDANSTVWLTDLIFKTAHRLGYSKQFLDEPRGYADDHIPFVNAGVAAADILDLDYGPRDSNHPNGAYWHTPQDTVDKCSAASLNVVGRVVAATLEALEQRFQSKR
ncbi:MAG TPA: M28 family peptidase [Terriglobia bacterium]|nr:M28 family peptidase [Terriglobia bacterium]